MALIICQGGLRCEAIGDFAFAAELRLTASNNRKHFIRTRADNQTTMGNFEKILILIILLVCAIVFGISIHGGDQGELDPRLSGAGEIDQGNFDLAQAAPGGSRNPNAAEGNLDGGQPNRAYPGSTQGSMDPAASHGVSLGAPVGATTPQVPVQAGTEGGRDLDWRGEIVADSNASANQGLPLLNAAEKQQVDPNASILIQHEGLAQSAASEQFFIYTCRRGDSWQSIARTYYGDAARVDLLQMANEDLGRPLAGKAILVPAVDLVAVAEGRAAAKPQAPRSRTYAIQEGDTLSTISKRFYDTSAHWMQIYDANRNVLSDPNTLKLGTVLRIP